MSCEVLEADGTIEENYKEDIIACVEKYGPYIVIAPNIAMPHSQEGAKGVHKTEIAFMKLKKPVSFEEGNPELDAQIFFTLAACNNEQHLQNMSRLSEMLMNEELVGTCRCRNRRRSFKTPGKISGRIRKRQRKREVKKKA